jgi:hypothetical protein
MRDHPASPDPMCIITRLSFSKRRHALLAHWKFRRLRKVATERVPGFVDATIRGGGTGHVFFISIWRTERSVFEFTTLSQHVDAVRWAIRARAVVWSGAFDLRGTSSMSTEWISTPSRWFEVRENAGSDITEKVTVDP